jgi:hypothetical protein
LPCGEDLSFELTREHVLEAARTELVMEAAHDWWESEETREHSHE